MKRVKVFGDGAGFGRAGRGLFADALISAMPLLPVKTKRGCATPGSANGS